MLWEDQPPATDDPPLLGEECDPDYLALLGLGLLVGTALWLVALAWMLT